MIEYAFKGTINNLHNLAKYAVKWLNELPLQLKLPTITVLQPTRDYYTWINIYIFIYSLRTELMLVASIFFLFITYKKIYIFILFSKCLY